MTITIYDYNDKKQKVNLPIKEIAEIEAISVVVVSGDETGIFLLKNGEEIFFDAGDSRLLEFYDGAYLVRGTEQIKKWINYVHLGERRTASYERRDLMIEGESE